MAATTPATLIRRGRPRALPVAGDDRRVLIDLAGHDLGLRFAEVRFRDSTSAAFTRVTLSAVLADAHHKPPLDLVAYGGGLFRWIGLLPRSMTHLELAPSLGLELPPLSGLTVTALRPSVLIGTGLSRHPHRVAAAAFWWCLRKRLRARHRMAEAIRPRRPSGYEAWVARFDTLDETERRRIRSEIAAWRDAPLISVVMPVYNPDLRILEQAVASVRHQIYANWELCIADDASDRLGVAAFLERAAAADPRIRLVRRSENGHIARATNSALALAGGPFCAFLDHDDLLPENALYEVARALIADPNLDLIYSDEDKVDARGRRFEPHFKPDWNLELLFAQNYINHLTVLRTERVRAVGGLRPGFEGSQDHDLLLRISDTLKPEHVLHIPKVLYRWRAGTGSGTFSDTALARAESARRRALEETLQRRNWPHRVEKGPAGFNRLIRAVPEPAPLVSVVIPTRDRAELLAVALDGLLNRTVYPALEAVVVDNGSIEPATAALFARHAGDARVRVIADPGPFNFSRLSNLGAAAARGSVLVFLNNDIEVIEPGWLTELVSIAVSPEVGAVGAKLLYPDGTLQHGGVVLGAGGIAGHSHLGIARDDPGYFARMTLTHQVSAVTGACLAIRKLVFEATDGFDAERLAVAFNDIDLCLKLGAAGYQVIWTPHAVLTHHESKSRGREHTLEKRARFETEMNTMIERWHRQLACDPFYNPNLSRSKASFRLI